ncbi:MAG: ornithine carbamoyltransferase [Albidovulum sp.]|nr:ornithine carbamoyltransferase [Albidovulum sp.]
MPDFLDLSDIPSRDLEGIIARARETKNSRIGRANGETDADTRLGGKLVALVFEKPSTRTRVSFEAAVRQQGGQALVLYGSEMQLGRGETVADTARVLSRYVDLIMIRTFDHNSLFEFAEHANVPVVNGLTNKSHPCQIMADIMTYEEKRGSIRGRSIAWFGSGNNVCTSFLHAAGRFGFDFVFSGPVEMQPCSEAVDFARENGASVQFEFDPYSAVVDADLIVTDAWTSMHDAELSEKDKLQKMLPFQVNGDLMAKAKPDALFMHCLPAHREEEVTSEVMDGPQSVVFDETENRLHVQKSILSWCLDS